MIRPATLADVDQLLELGRTMHAESPQWSRLTYDEGRMGLTLRSVIVDTLSLLLVADVNGEILAGVMATARPHWSSNDLIAQEMALFVRPDMRGTTLAPRLVRAFKTWAYDIGAVLVQAGASTGLKNEGCAKLYERLGFSRAAIGLEVWHGH